MSKLEALAQLQDLDTRLDQLRHKREHLPERAALVDIDDRITALEGDVAALESQVHGLRREQKRHEDEVAGLEEKAAKANSTMYDGTITSPKELTALQDEIDSLARRQGVVEESILELMEQADPLDDEIRLKSESRVKLDAEQGRASATLAMHEAEIDVEIDAVNAERDQLVTSTDAELVETYEKHRASMRGRVAVGRLDGTTCTACHLDLSAVEVDRIRHLPPEELAQCEECGALLVR